ncbi:hypothetical protein EPD60_01025 [Flaviaesturariibacter flavus]|uniref:Uncharacterized protein n=1 Tax=Flaviaesturariibacter flavus TaxID=2502780 RepID=A0A4R1BNP6_9BACT|nr:hypothetical protein [Flaviaesturariibacter flavus]TCJ19028.1 hypothetical protein EPD60_01025 [Flaviaesturariibacter flavus]
MATITNTNSNFIRTSVALKVPAEKSFLARFVNWADDQEKYRFGWVAGILAAHGCVMTPITLIAIVLGGNNIFLWVAAIVAMGAALVANLAAQPMKVTIPVFFTSLLVDLAIIASCLVVIFG